VISMVRAEFMHLKPDEKEIMERFIVAGLLPGLYEYDVHLSVPDPVWPEGVSEEQKNVWRMRIAKRIDAVCKQPDRIWLLEVTPKLSRAAVGGLLLYKQLYKAGYHPLPPLYLGVITAIDDPAYHPLLKENNITHWVV